jgi:nudix-type nucleoside diphosphatase (YffH/AdpP family)
MIRIPNAGFHRVSDQIVNKNFYIRTAIDEFSVDHPHEAGKIIGPTKREYVISRAAVAVLVYCPSERHLIMSRQFRMPVMFDTNDPEQAWIYEIFAGVVSDGESHWETAIREAEEEGGIKLSPENLVRVAELYPTPGMSSEKWSVYTCALTRTVPIVRNGGLASEAEAIVSEWISYDAASKLMTEQKIRDAKTYIALKSIGL